MFGRRTRGLWICIAAAMLIAGSAFTAYADTTIANIRVTFKNNYDKEEGQILEPTVTTGSGYEVEDISWSKALEKWNPGSKITASVTLVPGSGKMCIRDRLSILYVLCKDCYGKENYCEG